MNERTDVLCGCGWGLIGIPLEDAPDHCPVCGYSFRAWEDEVDQGRIEGQEYEDITDQEDA